MQFNAVLINFYQKKTQTSLEALSVMRSDLTSRRTGTLGM